VEAGSTQLSEIPTASLLSGRIHGLEDSGIEIDVPSRMISMARKALGYSFFRTQFCREIFRVDFDIAHHD
jgi:hypothetical protein